MLLDRGHRQNRDDLAHVGGGKIAPAHLGPELGWQHPDLQSVQGARAATASISTLNSGRAKPWTTIKVEAGGGLPTNSSRTFM